MDNFVTLRCTKYDYLTFLQSIFAQGDLLPKHPDKALLMSLMIGRDYLQRNLGYLSFPKPHKQYHFNLPHADAVAAYILFMTFGGDFERMLAQGISTAMGSYGIFLQ